MANLLTLPATVGNADYARWIVSFAERNPTHAVLLLHPDGQVLWCNQAARTLLGPTSESLAGRHYSEFYPPAEVEAGMPGHELEVALSRDYNLCQRWLRRLDDTRFWGLGTIGALRDEQGTHVGYLKTFRDMTAGRMETETLHNQVAELTREVARLREGLAVLGHELRNPLSALVTAAALVERICDMPTEIQDTMSRNAKAASRMIDDLVDHARADAGKLQMEREEVDLRELLQQAIDVALLASGKSRPIEYLTPSAPILLCVDRTRMQQVFTNLVGNAIRFTAEDGKIWVTAGLEGGEAVVHVADQGAGIPHEMLEQIFEMFTQVGGRTSSGLGVGLALVKRFVEGHGGTVQARSEGAGLGSEFLVRLPLGRPHADPAEALARA